MSKVHSVFIAFANAPFMAGVARALDFWGVLNEPTPAERRKANAGDSGADVEALRQDWEIVSEDLTAAVGAYEVATRE